MVIPSYHIYSVIRFYLIFLLPFITLIFSARVVLRGFVDRSKGIGCAQTLHETSSTSIGGRWSIHMDIMTLLNL